MRDLIAKRIKSRRKELKLSQNELAEGICKQGQISRLENGEYTPGSELLYQLAKKLNVSMDYFFDEQTPDDSIELVEFKKIAKTFITKRDYQSLRYVFELEKAKKHHFSVSDEVYFEWIESIVEYYVYNGRDKAIERLEKVLNRYRKVDINYLQVSNALFTFYQETENLVKFDLIKNELINHLQKIPLTTMEELELYIKIRYNLCRYLWIQKNIESAIKQITTTIDICKEYRTTYLLPDLFLLLGNICENFSDKTEVKVYFETAHFLYKNLEDNQEMALTVEHYLREKFLD